MNHPLVYLAGGIAGLAGPHATVWRQFAASALLVRGIECLDPMRAKLALSRQVQISSDFNDYAEQGAFFTSRGRRRAGD